MTYIYNRNLKVSPFIIVPIALIDHEAALALGPKILAKRNADLIHQLYSYIVEQNVKSPVIAQVIPYEGEVLIATTIQTKVPDANSGRYGLKLTYGALVAKDLFFYYSDVCAEVFRLLELYLQSEFGITVNIAGANEIVAKFQQRDKRIEELISESRTDELLNSFESEFCIADKRPLTIVEKIKLRFINSRVSHFQKLKPLSDLENTKTFWKIVDEALCGSGIKESKSHPQRGTVETVSIQLPAHVLGVIKKTAAGRHMSYQDLLKLYVEQGIRQSTQAATREKHQYQEVPDFPSSTLLTDAATTSPTQSPVPSIKFELVAIIIIIIIGLSGIASIVRHRTISQKTNLSTPTKTPRQIASEKTEQAMEMLYINDYDGAKALSKEATVIDPTYALAHAIYGDAAWDTDQTEVEDSSKNMESQLSKVEIFKIFNAKEPSTEEDFAARGWAFLDDGKWDRAKQDIEKVVAKRAEWAWALTVKASVTVSTGCVEKNSKEILDAINTLKKVNSLQSKYAMAYVNLAGAYRCNGQNQDAIAAYRQAINVRPSPEFYVRRGNFYLDSMEKKTKQKNIENAQKDFEAALKINPESSQAHVGLARIHEAKKEYEDCIKEAEMALKKPSFYAYRQRTVCRTALASKGKDETGFDEALENIERAKEEINKYSDPIEQQNVLANYYYLKAYIYNSKAFYLLSEKYLKNRIPENKDKVNTELYNAKAAIKQARDINHDKDSDKDYEKLENIIEGNIRVFKRFLKRDGKARLY